MKALCVILCIASLLYSDVALYFNSPLIYHKPQNSCESQTCKPLLKLIKESKKSIDVVIYGLREQDEILNALIEAKDRGVIVRVVSDVDTKGGNYYDPSHILANSIHTLKTDSGRGASYIMHNKFFVFDGSVVWSGSTNISSSCNGGYNANSAVVIKNREIAKAYMAEFDEMYERGRFHRKKEIHKNAIIEAIDTKSTKLKLSFSPKGDSAEHIIIPAIKGAKERIDIAMFYFTHKEIADVVVDAHNRGVSVRAIMDASGSANRYSVLKNLRDAGIPTKVENWGGKMHMKLAVIDGKHLINGSMNWTKAGNSTNDENTLLITDTKVAKEAHEFFEYMWSSIPDKYLTKRARAESTESINSCSDGIDNDFDGEVDMEDDGCGKSSEIVFLR